MRLLKSPSRARAEIYTFSSQKKELFCDLGGVSLLALMWPFRRRTRSEPNGDLVERMEALERAIRNLKTDWDETYEKFSRLNARLAKRIKRGEELEGNPGEEDDRPSAGNLDGRARSIHTNNPLARQLLGG